jgi:TonB-linked SusC/RagA family outer membrane protein
MRRIQQVIIGAVLAVLCAAPLGAQESTGTVRGRVVDNVSQQPLSGVMVTVGSRSALTQPDGRYRVTAVPAGTGSLRARLLGYAPATQSVTIAGGDTVVVDVTLTAQALGLAEVVVVGYGEQSAGNITGAVTHVSSEQFNSGRIVSPEQLIENKVAGVQLVDNNEPGGGITIRIRGATSVNASADPLYVVDGVPLGIAAGAGSGISAGRNPLNFLDPNDIESITLLKDASAAAIYGVNAANGVVLITTKSGRGAPQVEYGGSASASSVTRLPSMLNAKQFRDAVTTYAPSKLAQLDSANTNWFDLVDRTAMGQTHDAVVTGSNDRTTYRLSVGVLNQDGILKGTNTQRQSLGLNLEQRLFDNRLRVRANFKGSRGFDQFTPGGVLYNAAQMGPTQPVYDTTTPTGYYNWPGNKLTSADNPLEWLNLGKAQGTTYRSIGNLQTDYNLPFLPGLKATVNLGYDLTRVTSQTFNPSALHSEIKSGERGYSYRGDPSQLSTVLETYGNYAAPLNIAPGSIDLTAGYSFSQAHGESPSLTLTGLGTDLLGTDGFPAARNVSPGSPNIQENRLISFFARANYNLNDRYLATLSVRRDGSSRFGAGKQWGMFPAASVGWRISEEPFMKDHTPFSDLKLRASWGKTGNQAFQNYLQYVNYTFSNPQAQIQFGNQFISTIRPAAVNPNIQWEQTTSYDLGLDYGFAGQRFSGSVDWYRKNTSQLIFTVPTAAGTNFSNFVTQNIGSMKNTGIEATLSARMKDGGGGGLSWNADFTAGHNTNELTSITASGVQRIQVGGVAGGVGTTIQVLQPGQPINSFYTCPQQYAAGKPVQGKYISLADTVASSCDAQSLRPSHDPSPKWILGHSSYLTYRNFDLSFTLRAWLGNYVYNNVASNLGTYQELNRDSPYNLHTSVLETGFTSPQYLSDYYVENGSFLRMDNITAGYSFKWGEQRMHVYGTVQNVFTITGYSGVDPTAGLNGIDNNIYPRSRTVTGGLSVRF